MTSKTSKQQRLARARLLRAKSLCGMDTCDPALEPPAGAIMADPEQLAHNNTYGPLPRFYVDRVVVCRECKKEEVWPAENQKWWYEQIMANIHSQAILCRKCRRHKKGDPD